MSGRLPGWAALALAASLALTGCTDKDDQARAKGGARAGGSLPNIVLISIDTLRADHLGCYGYERKTSPRIDRLAAEGALFENMISSTSWTLPAHAALFTGLADSVHGCLDMDQRLDESRVTLAERLKAVGYATVGFFSGPAMHSIFGIAQGFDQYADCTSFASMTMKTLASGRSLDGGEIRQAAHADITNPRVYQEVQSWLRQNQHRPFFLFIHMWDVHADYIPPPPYDRMFDPDYEGPVTGKDFATDSSINADMPERDLRHLIALYDGEIAWTDHHVGMILDDLDTLGLRQSTIVTLLSDHGDEHFEHGLKGHRKTLYDEVIRVPLIIRYPGQVPPGRRLAEQARMIDVLPTLLDLAGLPSTNDVMGHSLTPLFSGGKLAGDTLAISELFSEGRRLRSFRRLDRKVIYIAGTQRARGYNLLADPGEQVPLTANSPWGKLMIEDARLGNKWLADFQKIVKPVSVASGELPENVRRQLESLGYIGASGQGGGQTDSP
ncbi:MAG: sulfatase [Phycisphaerales bacterium]|nr:MAG: sulfatase [Phycisphaerales bacterium]